MSVLVSDARNTNFAGSLATTNGMIKADTFNLIATGTSLALTSTQTITFTPTTSYTNNGVILCIIGVATIDRSVIVNLQQNVSGTWTTVGTQTLTAASICDSVGSKTGNWIVPFKWTGVAVTAVASTWRYTIAQTGGTTGTFNLATADGTNAFYVALSTIQATFTSNQDQVIFMDVINIDGNYILKRNSSTVGVCGILCKSASAPTYSNDIGTLTWFSPSASYEFGIDGGLVFSAHSALRIGKSTVPITVANKAVVNFNYKSSGTQQSGLYGTWLGSNGNDYKPSIFCFGQTVTNQYATLNADATSGQATATTALNLSSWPTSAQLGPSGITISIASPGVVTTLTAHCLQAGDQIIFSTTGALPTGITAGTIYYVSATSLSQTQFQFSTTSGGSSVNTSGSQSGTHTLSTATRVYVGKQDLMGQGSTTYNALKTAVYTSATTLTFNENIATNNRRGPINGAVGGVIVNIDGYSIVFKGGSTNAATVPNIQIEGVSNLYFVGTAFQEVSFASQLYTNPSFDDAANLVQWTWNNCLFIQRVTPTFYVYPAFVNITTNASTLGTLITNTAFIVVSVGVWNLNSAIASYGSTMNTCWILNGAGSDNTLLSITSTVNASYLVIENTANTILLNGFNIVVKNCRSWGCSQSFDGVWNMASTPLFPSSGIVFSNNTYNKCGCPLMFNAVYGTFTNESFGNEVANTSDVKSNRSTNIGMPNMVFNTPLTTINLANTVLSGVTNTNPAGSYIRILNEDNVSNSNRSFYSTGYYTAPTTSTLLGKTFLNGQTSTFGTLTTTFNNYTFLVSGFSLGVQVTVQIANSAYYTGGSGVLMPTLAVYADGQASPVMAIAATSSTSAQTLNTNYNFTSNNNNLNVTLSQQPTSACTEANSGVTWSNLVFTVRQYNYQYQTYTTTLNQSLDAVQQTLSTPVSNTTFLTDALLGFISYSAASSLGSNITFNGITINVNANMSVTQLYAYFQWWATQTANLNSIVPITTTDGTNFYSTANLTLNNMTLSGSGSQKLINIGSNTYTNNNSQLSGVTIVDASGTHIQIQLTNLVVGSVIQIYDTTTSTELVNTTTSGTTYTYYTVYSGSDNIRVRVRNPQYLPFETTTQISATNITIVINQIADPIYAQTGVDGSTVTEFSFSGSQVKIYVNGTTTTVQRLIAWYLWTISSSAYIGLQPDDISLPSSTWAQFSGGLTIKNQNSSPVTISGGNITDTSNNPATVIDTSGGPMFIVSSAPSANATDMAAATWANVQALTVGKFVALK